ncbi:hypothetical protein ACFVX3_33115 [Rhodococcus erythropolis]
MNHPVNPRVVNIDVSDILAISIHVERRTPVDPSGQDWVSEVAVLLDKFGSGFVVPLVPLRVRLICYADSHL